MTVSSPGTKTRRTYYTPERVAAARVNVERYEWAADRTEDAVSRADRVVEEGLDRLWLSIPGQTIPRAGLVGDGNGRETWKPVDGRPWKITDGEVVLPTNDFAAYRKSGRDDRGFFDSALADESLLVNEEYPDRPDDWGVDDGTGWCDADGDIADPGTLLVPVAFFTHFYRWYDRWHDLVALRDAFLYTGDRSYARAGCVLLDRIADEYPRMDIGAYSADRFWNSHGGTGQGKVLGSIWETNLVRNLVSAYDALFPAFNDDLLIEFLTSKVEDYPGIAGKPSSDAIRGNVERGIIREVLPAVERAQIRGNLGMHQATLAMAAVVMDEPNGYTGEAFDFLHRSGELRTVEGTVFRAYDGDAPTTDRKWELTGGDLSSALVEKLDRDGYGYEAAPNYNLIIRRQLERVAAILDRLDSLEDDHGGVNEGTDEKVNANPTVSFDHPKLRSASSAYYPLLMLNRYMPSIGDSGLTGNPEPMLDASAAVRRFETYGDPMFARVAHLLNGLDASGLESDVFSPDADAVPDQIESAVEACGPYNPGSVLEPSYGFAALRDGARDRTCERGESSGHVGGTTSDDRRAVTFYFGRNGFDTGSSHCHANALDLGIYAHELALAPDLGYPEHTGDWPKHDWVKGTISHNTVVVDEESQHPVRVGDPTRFDNADLVSMIDIDAPNVYPTTDTYRRTSALIWIDDAASYVADFFRVSGGSEHVFSFHGAEGTVCLEDLDPTPCPGTYAGPDVPFPDPGERTEHGREVGNGFDYLQNVACDDAPPERFAVDWDVVDTWDVRDDDAGDVHLRLTALGAFNDVSLADGEPPRRDGNPETLQYLLARRTGDGLVSVFRSVIEPYTDEPSIAAVKEPTVDVRGGANAELGSDSDLDIRAIRVELETGRTDWIVSADNPQAEYAVDDRFVARGAFAFYAEREESPVAASLTDGTLLNPRPGRADGGPLLARESPVHFEGRVVDFTRTLSAENEIVVETVGRVDLEDVVGRTLHVATDGGDNGVYEITDVKRNGNRVVANVGDATTVEGHVDRDGPNAGYKYVFDEGASVRVPASEHWWTDER